MLKMVDGTGIIGVDMVCPLGGTVSPPQPPNYDKIEVEGVGSLMLPNSLKAPLERVELLGNSTQGENPAPDNPQEIKSAGKWNEEKQKYEIDVKVTNSEQGWTEEQTLTLTSDRLLTKWDKLVEQDGQIGWLYKHKIIEDFSTLVKDTEPIYGKDGEKYFSVSLQNASLNYDRSKIYSEVGLSGKDSKIHYAPRPSVQSVVIYVSDTDTIMTAKEHMHYKVIYETTESQFAPLSESEQTQLRNLHSYNGTTNITVDSGEVPCGIKLTYRKEI
jgi:hypothetical protein